MCRFLMFYLLPVSVDLNYHQYHLAELTEAGPLILHVRLAQHLQFQPVILLNNVQPQAARLFDVDLLR